MAKNTICRKIEIFVDFFAPKTREVEISRNSDIFSQIGTILCIFYGFLGRRVFLEKKIHENFVIS